MAADYKSLVMMTIKERMERIRLADLVTIQDVALLLSYSPQTVYRKSKRGEIPGMVRFGRTIRFRRVVVAQWVRAQTIDANA